MALEAYDIVERFAIMAVDGGLSDLDAMRLLLKRWPVGRGTFQAWNIAMVRIGKMDSGALALLEGANASAVMMARL